MFVSGTAWMFSVLTSFPSMIFISNLHHFIFHWLGIVFSNNYNSIPIPWSVDAFTFWTPPPVFPAHFLVFQHITNTCNSMILLHFHWDYSHILKQVKPCGSYLRFITGSFNSLSIPYFMLDRKYNTSLIFFMDEQGCLVSLYLNDQSCQVDRDGSWHGTAFPWSSHFLSLLESRVSALSILNPQPYPNFSYLTILLLLHWEKENAKKIASKSFHCCICPMAWNCTMYCSCFVTLD